MKPWEANGGPDVDTLRKLVHTDQLTDHQIGEMYDAADSTVRYWRSKAKIVREPRTPRLDHRATGGIPWELDTARGHHRDPIARLLRDRNRHLHGLPIEPDALKRVETFEADLADMGLVVDYDKERGFVTRTRDPELDDPNVIVRMPAKVNA